MTCSVPYCKLTEALLVKKKTGKWQLSHNDNFSFAHQFLFFFISHSYKISMVSMQNIDFSGFARRRGRCRCVEYMGKGDTSEEMASCDFVTSDVPGPAQSRKPAIC